MDELKEVCDDQQLDIELETLRQKIKQQAILKLKADAIRSNVLQIKARHPHLAEKRNEDGNAPVLQGEDTASGALPPALKEKSDLLKKEMDITKIKVDCKRSNAETNRWLSKMVGHLKENIKEEQEQQRVLRQQLRQQADSPIQQPELQQRIAELEKMVQQMKESLKEKDGIISARTQALTQLHQEMSQRNKETANSFEEIRTQMKVTQRNFEEIELRINQEKKNLRELLDAKTNECFHAERTQYTLSNQVKDLQQQVARLQDGRAQWEEEKNEIEKRSEDLQMELQQRIQQMGETIDQENKQAIKMKVKLKSLRDENNQLKKVHNDNQVTELQNHIALLEEEKGNLQLQLVESDQLKERLEVLNCRNDEFGQHIKAIAVLELEKLDLIQDVKELKSALDLCHSRIQEQQNNLIHCEQLKVCAEMKAVELEEKLDKLSATQVSCIDCDLGEINQQLQESKDLVHLLTEKLSCKEEELTQLKQHLGVNDFTSALVKVKESCNDLLEWKKKYEIVEEKLEEALKCYNNLRTKLESLDKERNDCIKESNLLWMEIELLKESCYSNETVALPAIFGSSDELNSIQIQFGKSAFERTPTNDNNNDGKLISPTINIQNSRTEVHKLTKELDAIGQNNKIILNEAYKLIEIKDNEIEKLNETLNEKSKSLSEYKKFHKLKSEDVMRVSLELQQVTESNQRSIADLEEALNASKLVEEDLRRQLVVKTETKSHSEKIKKLVANLKLKAVQCQKLEAKIEQSLKLSEDLSSKLAEKEIEVNEINLKLEKKDMEVIDKVTENKQQITELNRLLVESETRVKELLNVSDQLDVFKHERTVFLKHIDDLQLDKNKMLDSIVRKDDDRKQIETDMLEITNELKIANTELERVRCLYIEEAEKNKVILESLQNFEHEILVHKNKVAELGEKLKDVSMCHQETSQKLHEKEAQVVEFESKMCQLELALENQHQSLESKAETMGANLGEAEDANVRFKNVEREFENRLVVLIENQKSLEQKLNDAVEENRVLRNNINQVESKNKEVENDISNYKMTIDQLNSQLFDLANVQSLYNESLQTVNALNDELMHTKNNLVEALNQSERNSCYIYDMESELKTTVVKSDQLQTERDTACNQLNIVLEEKNYLEKESLKLKDCIHNYEENIESMVSALQAEKIMHESLKDQLNLLEKQLSERIQESDKLAEEAKEKEAKLEQLEKGNDNLRRQLIQIEEKTCNWSEGLAKQEKNEQNDDERRKFARNQSEQIAFDIKQSTEISKLQKEHEHLLAEERKEKEQLKIELLKEKAMKEVACVVSEAEKKASFIKNEETGMKIFNWDKQEELPQNQNDLFISSENDGWSCGLEETKHQLSLELKELIKKNQYLENNNKRLSDELKLSQLRCGKLTKKAKELQTKNIDLEKQSSKVVLDDLDLAMQDELQSQINELEKKLQESLAKNSTLKIENDEISKKVETLSCSNNYLVEIKERQNVEVAVWQKRSSELQDQVQGLEWKIEELMAENEFREDDQNIKVCQLVEHTQLLLENKEIEEKLLCLANENEELQKIMLALKKRENEMDLTIKMRNSNKEWNETCLLLLSKIFGELFSESDNIRKLSIDSNYKTKMEQEFLELTKQINALIKENNVLRLHVAKYDKLENVAAKPDCWSNMEENLGHQGMSKDSRVLLEKEPYMESILNLEAEHSNPARQPQLDEAPVLFRGFSINPNTETFPHFVPVEPDSSTIINNLKVQIGTLESLLAEKECEIKSVKSTIQLGKLNSNQSSTEANIQIQMDELQNSYYEQIKTLETNYQYDILAKEEENAHMICEISSKEQQLMNIVNDLHNSKKDLEIAQKSVREMAEEFESTSKTNQILTEELNSLKCVQQDCMLELQSELRSKEVECYKYLVDLSEKSEIIMDLQARIHERESNATQSEIIIEELRERNSSLGHEHANFVLKCNDADSSRIENNVINVNSISKQDAECMTDESSDVVESNQLLHARSTIELNQQLEAMHIEKQQLFNDFQDKIKENYTILCDLAKCEKEKEELHLLFVSEKINVVQPIIKLGPNQVSDQQSNYESNKDINIEIAACPKETELLESAANTGTANPLQTDQKSTEDNKLGLTNELSTQCEDMTNVATKLESELNNQCEKLEREEVKLKVYPNRKGHEEMDQLEGQLDDALYALHQRDVRCDELTLELMKLLEERDTLQLRLSTALKTSEELRGKKRPPDELDVTRLLEGPDSISDDATTLNEKLEQLHSVGYRRDPEMCQDQEKRYTQQMQLYMQQTGHEEGDEDANPSSGFFSWFLGV